MQQVSRRSWSPNAQGKAVLGSEDEVSTAKTLRDPLWTAAHTVSHELLTTHHAGIVKGAESSAVIAAASIVCKCLLDDVMLKLDEEYPDYGELCAGGALCAHSLNGLTDNIRNIQSAD